MTFSLLGAGSLANSLLGFLMGFLSLFLIMLILIQRGKGGGLTGALGGPGGQSAFGSKAGDTFTAVTIVVASIWGFTCAFAMWLNTYSPPDEMGLLGDNTELVQGSDEGSENLSGGGEPAATEPAATEPAVTEPAVTEPAVTEPAATEPAVTEPAEPAAETDPTETSEKDDDAAATESADDAGTTNKN